MMTRVKQIARPCLALALVAALSLALLAMPARAANEKVDLDRKGTLTVQMPNNTDSDEAMLADLKKPFPGEESSTVITVHLYKVANINEGGSYIGGIVDGLKGTEFEQLVSTVNEEWQRNTNDYWNKATIALLKELYNENDLIWADGVDRETTVPTLAMDAQQKQLLPPLSEPYEVELTADNHYMDTVENMDLGLYLAVAETVNSHRYTYSFTPWLLSVPMVSVVAADELDPGIAGPDGEGGWLYSYTATLKPQREQRMGELVIEKKLATFNASLGKVPFVFQVDVYLDGDLYSSNTRTFFFDNAGSRQIVVENVPVEAKVVVTEVYSGGSYTLTVDESNAAGGGIEIPALDELYTPEEMQKFWGELNGETVGRVYFENDYKDNIVPSMAVENQFSYHETESAGGGTIPSLVWKQNSGTAPGTETEGGEQG